MTEQLQRAISLYVKAEKLRLSKKNDEKAIQAYQAVLEEQQDFYEAYERMGLMYQLMKRPAQAIESFAMAAAGYIKEKKFVAAASVYMKIISIDPELVKDSSKKTREMLGKLPFVDARVLNSSLICDLVPRPAFFKDLSEREFAGVIRNLNPVELSESEILFHEGSSESRDVYMIYSGRMAVVSYDSQEREVIVATLGPGEFFGEFSFLTDAPRSATMKALEDTVLFELSRERMRHIIKERPPVGEALQQYYKTRVLDLALARLELFSGIPGKDRQKIIERFAPVEYAAEQVVMDSRHDEGHFFLVKTGTVTVLQEEAGLILDEQHLKAGDLFWYNNPNSSAGALVKATADIDCELMVLKSEHLAQSSGKVPALGKKLGELMAANPASGLHVLRPVEGKQGEGE